MPIVFEMYLGFVLIRYEEMTDTETTALKEASVTYNSQKERTCHVRQGHTGKGQGQLGGKKGEGKV